MPKSRLRKNRKPYRPAGRHGYVYQADPLEIFAHVAKGDLGPEENEAACQLLLKEMGNYDPEVMKVICGMAGLSEPPSTTDHIRAIAKALVTSSEPAHADQH
jgi:hypothetical protein